MPRTPPSFLRSAVILLNLTNCTMSCGIWPLENNSPTTNAFTNACRDCCSEAAANGHLSSRTGLLLLVLLGRPDVAAEYLLVQIEQWSVPWQLRYWFSGHIKSLAQLIQSVPIPRCQFSSFQSLTARRQFPKLDKLQSPPCAVCIWSRSIFVVVV